MSRPIAVPRSSAAGRNRRGLGNPWLTLIAVAFGVIMVALDATVVAIANPAISKDLGASLSDLQWVTNGYLLALAVSLITAGRLGDRFGHKPIFLLGAAGFALSSAGIGLSGTIGLVIALRVLQGLFGAMLQPTALGLLRAAFPAERLNVAIGIWGSCIAASTAAGPIVGGLLVQHIGWQAVFFINVPVGAVTLILGGLVIRNARDRSSMPGFDVTGMLLLSGTLFTLVWAIIKAPSYGWADAETLAFFGGFVVLLALFLLRERMTRGPLLPLTLFRSLSLSAGTVLMVLMAFGMFGGTFFLTFYLQSVHGLTPVATGVRLLPMMLTMVVASPIAGGLISKVGPRIPLVAGMVCTGGAFLGLTSLGAHTGFATMASWLALLGLGLSPVLVSATDVIVGNAPVSLAGVAGGLQQVAMQVGGALGTSVLGAVMTSEVADVLPGHMRRVGLPVPPPAQVDQMKGAIAEGIAPVPAHAPPQLAHLITEAADLAFIDGMHAAFAAGAVVVFIGAALSLLVRAGRTVEGAAVFA